jgi:hypothetical protein
VKRFATLCLTFALALAGVLSTAAHAQLGGTGASLNIQPGGRQNGMGAAGVAVADDPTGATWWNPAGLGFVKKRSVSLTWAQLVPGLADDVSYNFVNYVQPLEGWGAFGVGVIFLPYGESMGTDITGAETGLFTSNEFSPAVYYGTQVLPDLAVGTALKYIRLQYAPDSQRGVGSTFGFDFAALYRVPAANLNLGINIENMGPSVTFVNEDQASPLSRNVKAGAAWQAWDTDQYSILVAGDFNQSLVAGSSNLKTYHGGAELNVGSNLSVRGGYYSDPVGEIEDFTFGLGLRWESLVLDFASIPQAKNSGLDNVKKITLGFTF